MTGYNLDLKLLYYPDTKFDINILLFLLKMGLPVILLTEYIQSILPSCVIKFYVNAVTVIPVFSKYIHVDTAL